MYVPRYTQLNLSADTAKAMVQAADLGTNIQRLYQHELYFRTNGRKGERLSSVDLERLYQNMSVWLWNEVNTAMTAARKTSWALKRSPSS